MHSKWDLYKLIFHFIIHLIIIEMVNNCNFKYNNKIRSYNNYKLGTNPLLKASTLSTYTNRNRTNLIKSLISLNKVITI